MPKRSNKHQFVDFVISEGKPSVKQRLLGDYRICSVTRRGDQRFINLRVPAEVQRKILSAYASGKQVRIFA
jgi:hypothetical protein